MYTPGLAVTDPSVQVSTCCPLPFVEMTGVALAEPASQVVGLGGAVMTVEFGTYVIGKNGRRLYHRRDFAFVVTPVKTGAQSRNVLGTGFRRYDGEEIVRQTDKRRQALGDVAGFFQGDFLADEPLGQAEHMVGCDEIARHVVRAKGQFLVEQPLRGSHPVGFFLIQAP